MAKSFADRWGVPVRASSAEAVAQLDEAIEDLAALAESPIAKADAAVAAEPNCCRLSAAGPSTRCCSA